MTCCRTLAPHMRGSGASHGWLSLAESYRQQRLNCLSARKAVIDRTPGYIRPGPGIYRTWDIEDARGSSAQTIQKTVCGLRTGHVETPFPYRQIVLPCRALAVIGCRRPTRRMSATESELERTSVDDRKRF